MGKKTESTISEEIVPNEELIDFDTPANLEETSLVQEEPKPERKLNTANDVMNRFGLNISQISDNNLLKKLGLTEREIKLVNISYNNEVKTSLEHLSTTSVPADIRLIMNIYGVTLEILKDNEKLTNLVDNESDLKTLKLFISKLLS